MGQSSINWLPHTSETFATAKKMKKPLFLYGYLDSSRWCDKFESQSLCDDSVQKLLNEEFIAVRFDIQKERALFAYYSDIFYLQNRHTPTVPLLVLLTYDEKPISSKGFLAPQARYNQPSLIEHLETIASLHQKQNKKLFNEADRLYRQLRTPPSSIEATHLNATIHNTINTQAKSLYDPTYGGFSTKPKLLHLSLVELLLSNPSTAPMAAHTLSQLLNSPMLSPQGFLYRYSLSNDWSTPYQEYSIEQNSYLLEILTTFGIHLDHAKLLAKSLLEHIDKNQLPPHAKSYLLFALSRHFDSNQLNNLILDHLNSHLKNGKIDYFEDDVALMLLLLRLKKISEAKEVAVTIVERYFNHGLWLYSSYDNFTRAKIDDNLLPSSIALLVKGFGILKKEGFEEFEKFALLTLKIHSKTLMHQPLLCPALSKEAQAFI